MYTLLYTGFPVTREVILTNLSEVVMTYSLKVPLDERRSISSNRGGNQEFLISPQADALPPGIPQAIKVSTIIIIGNGFCCLYN